MKSIFKKIKTYLQIVPDIAKYQFFSKIILAMILFVLKQISMLLIYSTGRVAISSGDLAILYKTWQGPLLVIIALGILFLYTAVDINSQIILAGHYLEGKQLKTFQIIKEGIIEDHISIQPKHM